MVAISVAQMRKIEHDAIASGRISGLELMERAGRGIVEAIFETWPDLAMPDRGIHPPDPRGYFGQDESRRAVVLCGPGNNGGDGFVVARLLAARGWTVEVFLHGNADNLPPDARKNYERWCENGKVQPYVDTGPDAFWLQPDIWTRNTLAIDALFGIGLSRPISDANAFGWVTQMSGGPHRGARPQNQPAYPECRVVAIDVPSGLDADTGALLCPDDPKDLQCHEEIRADLTVTFHRPKLGHILAQGPSQCGKLVVKDIGL